MCSWVDEELATLDLHDKRRDRRVKRMVATMAQNPSGSIAQTFTERAENEAAYRILHSDAVDIEAIRRATSDACVSRFDGERVVLAVQDTTFFNFTSHPATSGMGALGHSQLAGFLKHTVLAVSGDGVPLGLLHEQCWARDFETIGKKHGRKQRPSEDKESRRWIESQRIVQDRVAADSSLSADMTLITVADREADIFEFFSEPRPEHAHLLIRACQDRCVDGLAKHLWATARAAPVVGEFTITLRQHPERKPRESELALRFAPVSLKPPRNGVHKAPAEPVQLTAILVVEPAPPVGHKPVTWLLLTTLPVDDYHSARQCVRYYTHRWLIERYHYALKSGCKIEESQLRSREALERLICLYSIVAWRLLWMTYQARVEPETPCTVAFSQVEWQTLWRLKQGQLPLPLTPPSLREAIRWTASLAGFMGRKGDGEPGVKRLWRGLTRLQDIVVGVTLPQTTRDVRNA
jgi:hypothetical protein